MIRKNLLYSVLTAVAFGVLVSCAGSDDAAEAVSPSQSGSTAERGSTPVGFSAYLNRGVTRAGLTGELNTSRLELAQGAGGGFGVFAYYTDLKKYDQTYIPNFMYNQGVFKNGDNWEYTPVMYWPNEYGSDAGSDDEDKVTFFAYAPYVKHTSAASGSVTDATYGITGFSRNTTAGDPIVKYIASFDAAKSVDLCWGVCADASWNRIQSGGAQTMTAGLPWLDVEHPQGTSQKMTFTFRHALSQLNVQIDADPDITEHNETSAVASGTKIYVRSISFTGIAMKGALNLNNTVANEALWLDYSGSTDLPYGESVTVKDGRRDGREGASGAEATNETPSGLNPDIVQSTEWDDPDPKPGVTHELKNLFNGADLTTPVYVIPTGENMTVTIVYDVETENPSISGYLSDGKTHGVSIENKISKTISWSSGSGLECGKKYTLMLHLGMNSVKFNATVGEWEEGSTGNGWLPANSSLTMSMGSSMSMSLTGGTQSLTATTISPTVTWTNSNDGVASISTVAPTRALALTRGVQSIENTTAKTVYITPVAAGQTTVTCTDEQGNTASTVITVTAADIVPGETANPGQSSFYDLTQFGNALDALVTGITDSSGNPLTIGTDYTVTVTDPSGTPHEFNNQSDLESYINTIKTNGADGDYTVTITGTGGYAGMSSSTTLHLDQDPAEDPISDPTNVNPEGYSQGETGQLAEDLTTGVKIGGKSAELGDENGYTITIKDGEGNDLEPPVTGISSLSELEEALENLPAGDYTIEYVGLGSNTGATGSTTVTIALSDNVRLRINSVTDWENGDNVEMTGDKIGL